VAESKRRDDAVDERLDEEFDGDVLDADALEDEELVGAGAATGSASKPKRASGGDLSTRPPTKARATGERPGPFGRIRNFLREIISELRKVIWPTRKELLTYTAVVIVFVAIVASLVGGLDYGFAWLISHTLGTSGGKK